MSIRNRTTKFSALLTNAANPAGLCTTLLLAWVAHADGTLSDSEREFITASVDEMLGETNKLRVQVLTEELFAIATGNRVDDILIACQYLQRKLEPEDKRALLDLLISMMVSDNRVNLSERYIIEFLADLFGFFPDELDTMYRQITGKELPSKGDPSLRSWWEVKASQQSRSYYSETPKSIDERLAQAYTTLGLHYGAGQEEIHHAYRALAMRHHPDRFQALGDEAVRKATTIFLNIKNAYELLRAQ